MSHPKERKEKNCLNCNAVVDGRYCSICGQENLEPQEGVRHLVSHFFNDITHFDGKFFSSMKYLLRRPGFLSEEYMAGRRASYLNPVRMYVFTSFIFFLLIFSFFSSEQKHVPAEQNHPQSREDSVRFKSLLAFEGIDTSYANPKRRSGFTNFFILAVPGNSGFLKNANDNVENQKNEDEDDYYENIADSVQKNSIVAQRRNSFSNNDYRDRKEYDSLTEAGVVKDNFILRTWRHRQFSIMEKYGNNSRLINDKFVETFEHYIPQLFFFRSLCLRSF